MKKVGSEGVTITRYVSMIHIFQIPLIATRQETQTQTATALAIIYVNRNQNPPVFTKDVYDVIIDELLSYGNLTRVLATDADGVSRVVVNSQ